MARHNTTASTPITESNTATKRNEVVVQSSFLLINLLVVFKAPRRAKLIALTVPPSKTADGASVLLLFRFRPMSLLDNFLFAEILDLFSKETESQ